MRSNRHDTWQAFCDTHRGRLAGTGLPPSVTRSEHRFRTLLEHGRVTDAGTTYALEKLAPAAWADLYQFAAAFFRDFESFAPEELFPEFAREAGRRGDPLPR